MISVTNIVIPCVYFFVFCYVIILMVSYEELVHRNLVFFFLKSCAYSNLETCGHHSEHLLTVLQALVKYKILALFSYLEYVVLLLYWYFLLDVKVVHILLLLAVTVAGTDQLQVSESRLLISLGLAP